MRDPYEVLGIARTASDEEIKKAYRAQCKRWHPDLNPNDPSAEERFKEVQAAYDTITKGPSGGYAQPGYSSYNGQRTSYGQSSSYGHSSYSGFGFDPFGFGFGSYGYGSAQQDPQLQAAYSYITNRRYAEARRVLDAMQQRSGYWYYCSALAHHGMGNTADALRDARYAVQLEPNNLQYRQLLQQLQNPGQAYRNRAQTYSTGFGPGSFCLRLALLNLLCSCFCRGPMPFFFCI